MDTQNTPVHIKLWHREFWMLSFANMLLMTAVYALMAALPPYLLHHGFSPLQVGWVMGIYGIGLFCLGGFCSYLVQRYRRNGVCRWAILAVVACVALFYYLEFWQGRHMQLWMLLCLRLVLGSAVGVAQIVLGSTLVIDICESFQRTAANHVVAWFGRLAVALGPLAVCCLFPVWGYSSALLFSAAAALGAWGLVAMVKFPFKAPSDHMPLFTLDRFFLPQGTPLFLNLLLVTTTVGILFAVPHTVVYYAMVGAGLVGAIVAERFVFADADLKSEVLTGLLFLLASQLIELSRQTLAIQFISPALIGFAVGIMGSRFLLFFVKLANHCQRGTSYSSFFLAWEGGISLGLFLGVGVIPRQYIFTSLLALIAVSFVLYNFVVHSWYMKHKSR